MSNGSTLKVVGTGPMETHLHRRYTRAEFLGYREGDELKAIIAKSAFVVVPSEWYENCSMVVLEAMAMGKPVIGTRVGGIPEQIDDGKTGFLFDLGMSEDLLRGMNSLMRNPELRRKMGLAARKKVEKEYSLSRHCEKLLETYSNLLSRNP
jgi:glycosyltransferase involved in cell wall biosynthesis